jgi:hypothetical protein
MIGKLISLLMAIVFVGTMYFTDGAEDAMKAGGGMILILALIWFGDEMGAYTGPTSHGAITAPTPGCMLRAFGWIVLAGAFVLSLFQLVNLMTE